MVVQGTPPATHDAPPAEGMGALDIRGEKPGQVGPALARALAAVAPGWLTTS